MCYSSFRSENTKLGTIREKETMRRIVNGSALGLAAVLLTILSLQVFGSEDPVPKDIQIKKNPLAPSDATIAGARRTYTENCVQCHGVSGKGDGPMAGMLKETPAERQLASAPGGGFEGFWSACNWVFRLGCALGVCRI